MLSKARLADAHSPTVTIYWLLLVPYVVFLICLEFFKIPEAQPGAGRIIKRAVVSILLLYSFDECLGVMATVSDGITDKISGIVQLKDLLKRLEENYKSTEVSWLHVREAVLYIISLLSYIVAYLGVFVADVLIHFVWSILYVVSPLMILMYVSEKTAGVTTNLYRGLINVLVWKVFWAILGVLLLKLATAPEVASSDNFLVAVLMNLCIGLSMLFIPFATKSLIATGFESAATALAAAPAAAAAGAVKLYAMKFGRKAVQAPIAGIRATTAFVSGRYEQIQASRNRGRERSAQPKKVVNPVSHKLQTPPDKRGPPGGDSGKTTRRKE